MKKILILLLSVLFINSNSFSQLSGCADIDLGPDTTINCSSPCLTLNAQVQEVGLTDTYLVSSIPYVPPFPFNQGTSTIIGIDDVWGSVINLPFNFCFFLNTYNQIVIGANGVISFDISNAGGWCEWSFSNTIPNLTGEPYRNSINGAYHDMDPSVGGDIRYAILGSYPCRTFVVNYENIPHFQPLFSNCNTLTTTQQIVLYETTNIIEVYIQDKPTCNVWNNGNAVIGIQNISGTTAFVPPNRNTGPWSTSNEAWRFTPDGSSVFTIDWLDSTGTIIGTGDSIIVCPTATTTYSANVTYTICDGSQVIETDQKTVTIAGAGAPTVVANANNTTVCVGDPVTLTGSGALTYVWDNGVIDGVPFFPTTTNTYTVTGMDINGCINMDQITIQVNPSTISTSTHTTCDNYTWNGINYISSGTYAYLTTNSNGCDSTATLNLTINPSTISTSTHTACDSYTWNGTSYTSSGTYTYSTTNSSGCDSTANLNLTIDNSNTGASTVDICDTYNWNGQIITTSGSYNQTFTNISGCDSIHTLVATIRYSNSNTSTIDTCNTYNWNGQVITTSGSYTQTLTNASGCDSVHTLIATISYSNSGTSTIDTCNMYNWNGQIITTSGSYNQTFANISVSGCDSVHTLVVTIRYSNTGTSTIDTCDTYNWNGQIITTSGSYNQTFTNISGCDSVHTLVATITYSNTGTSTIDTCDAYNWNGQIITTSGSYTQTLTNAAGCDSLHILNLTIANSTTLSVNKTSCDTYTWNGTTYNISGIYTYITTNSVGCDSTVTLNLTVNSSSISTTTISSCNPYLWNGTTYNTSDTYTYSTINSVGCDSTAILDLIINPATYSYSTVTSCDPYTWNGTTYNTSGTYSYLTTDINGCDSTSTLNLTINSNSTTVSTSTDTSCIPYTWNGLVYDVSGEYTYTTVNTNGCDSIANLVLTIIDMTVFLPNSFTPNGNNLNEQFKVIYNNVKGYEMWIYSRWGELIFYSENTEYGWDGTYKNRMCQNGVYGWKVCYSCNGEPFIKKGFMTLTR